MPKKNKNKNRRRKRQQKTKREQETSVRMIASTSASGEFSSALAFADIPSSKSKVTLDDFMFSALRDGIKGTRPYNYYADKDAGRGVTFHHHVSKYKLNAFAESLSAHAIKSEQVDALRNFKDVILGQLSDFAENYIDQDLEFAHQDWPSLISKILIQLPYNFYAGYFFNNGNPGNLFDPGIDAEEGGMFEYVEKLKDFEQFIDRGFPALDDDEGWLQYFATLTEHLTGAHQAWNEQTGGEIYTNTDDWIERRGSDGKLSFAKKEPGIRYKTQDDISEIIQSIGPRDAIFHDGTAWLTEQLQQLETDAVVTDDASQVSLQIHQRHDVGEGDQYKNVAEHVLNRHSLVGAVERSLINTYFHKDTDHGVEDITLDSLRNNITSALETLKANIRSTINSQTLSFNDGTEDFNLNINGVGILATLERTNYLEDDEGVVLDGDNLIDDTPAEYTLTLKTLFPTSSGFIGEDSDPEFFK